MKRTGLVLLLITATVLGACRQDPPTPPTPPGTDTTTVVDALTEEGFTTLATAITAAGLGDTLAGDGPFTLFAPTDEAFAGLPEETLTALLGDPDALGELLSYHVLEEEVVADDLEAGFYPTLQESPLAVTLEGEAGAVTLNSISVVTEADIEADNGVVHGIDAVLSIPETEFAAPLAGANEVPPVESDATGLVDVTLEGTTLTVAGTYEGLTVADPGAHIHGPATAEANADVLFPLTFDNETGTLSATVDLAAEENAAFGPATFGYLQNGLLYANLHTEENPSGEIRGQLLPTDELPITDPDFTAALKGSEEVPSVTTDGSGTASAALDEAGTTLRVEGTYTDLSGAPVAGHIHEAPRGENGPVVVPLTLTPDETDPTSGTFSVEAPIGEGEGQLSAATLAENGYYLNLHTEENPDGEIRGQLSAVPTEPPAPAPTSR